MVALDDEVGVAPTEPLPLEIVVAANEVLAVGVATVAVVVVVLTARALRVGC